MTPMEASWVAGIIEGEGCIEWADGHQPRFKVAMTDLDVIERLQAWTGLGVIRPLTLREGCKQQWAWTVGDVKGWLALAEQVEPFLLARRSAKLREVRTLILQRQADVAERALAKFHPGVGPCPHGHDKAVVGVTTSGYCAECDRIRGRAQKAAKKVSVR